VVAKEEAVRLGTSENSLEPVWRSCSFGGQVTGAPNRPSMLTPWL
jgi:hypothetical protein